MTAKVNALLVILDKDIRIDDIEPLQNAIMQMKHVIEVKANIKSIQDDLAQSRVRQELGEKIIEVIYPGISGKRK
jgi:hypothetical protein